MTGKRKKILIAIAVVLGLLMLYRFGERIYHWVSGGEQRETVSRVPVRVHTAERTDLRKKLRLTGDVKGSEVVNLFAQVPGKIRDIRVKEGDRVRRGQTVMTINRDIVGMQYMPAIVESPITGYVGAVLVDRGMTVTQTMPLGQVVNMDQVEVIVYIIEEQINQVRLGMDAEIHVQAFPDRVFRGRVTKKSAVVDPVSRTQEVHINLTNKDMALRHGMFATVYIITDVREDVIVIPVDSLMQDKEGNWFVFIAREEKALRKNVTPGLRVENRIEIEEGLSEGERVINLGKENVSEGDNLIIYREEREGEEESREPGDETE
jgi:multidrug efflux pump subunit AcrA (membrane-fusion protein)